MLPGIKTPTRTTKYLRWISAITWIFSHKLTTVRESWKIPRSQVSYILGYADGTAVLYESRQSAIWRKSFIPVSLRLYWDGRNAKHCVWFTREGRRDMASRLPPVAPPTLGTPYHRHQWCHRHQDAGAGLQPSSHFLAAPGAVNTCHLPVHLQTNTQT